MKAVQYNFQGLINIEDPYIILLWPILPII